MKLTKNRLKEIIREEIQRLNEKKYSNLGNIIDNIHCQHILKMRPDNEHVLLVFKGLS